MKQELRAVAIATALLLVGALLPAEAAEASREQQLKQARETVDTSRFKKEPPYTIGLSAGYLTNSWVVFARQHILYEASQHPEIDEVVVTDANFNPAKQVADIEDLISKGVDLILYWPVDEQAIQGALTKAAEQGIATISTGGAFSAGAGTVANAYIDQWNIGELVARQLFEDMGGEGKIFAMLPIAGTTAAVDQLAALESVMQEYPDIELLSAEYGDWNRAKAKQITENLLQRYPEIDGVLSPAGQMSIGVAGRDVAGRRVQRLAEVGRGARAERRRDLPDARRPGGSSPRAQDPQRRAGRARPRGAVGVHRARGHRPARRGGPAGRLVGEHATGRMEAQVLSAVGGHMRATQ
jgi:ribose transport system substrate-binding protein